jgi:ABC-type uncharacterized transport system permease subunit
VTSTPPRRSGNAARRFKRGAISVLWALAGVALVIVMWELVKWLGTVMSLPFDASDGTMPHVWTIFDAFSQPEVRGSDTTVLEAVITSAARSLLIAGGGFIIGVSVGLLLALAAAAALWVFLFRTRAGFAQQVGGLAPAAARYAGFSSRRALWTALLVSGAAAGLAGALEVAGPIGQLTPYVPAGYGFAAIIVAFVGRLHPAGMVLSAILMSMFYIGGELAQSRLGLPKSITGVFQGLLLFCLLACDTLVAYRLRLRKA